MLVRMVSWNPDEEEEKSTQCIQQGNVKQLVDTKTGQTRKEEVLLQQHKSLCLFHKGGWCQQQLLYLGT